MNVTTPSKSFQTYIIPSSRRPSSDLLASSKINQLLRWGWGPRMFEFWEGMYSNNAQPYTCISRVLRL